MKTYRVYWKGGKSSVMSGVSIIDALRNNGFGHIALTTAIERYKEIKPKRCSATVLYSKEARK